jgi:hypothetical protein
MRRLLPILLVVLALAACGGGEEAGVEQWAGEVCTAVDSWQTELQGIFSDVQAQVTSGEPGAVDAIRSGIDQGVAATEQLGETLKGLEPPETDAGQEAQQKLEATADELSQAVSQVKATVDELGEASVQELISALAGIAVPLQAALGQAKAAVDSLRESAAEEIRQGFENAEACQELAGTVTGD